MRIAVLVKQVPATEDVKIDNKKGTLIREKSEVETNPTDLTAISQAVRIKKTIGKGEVIAISMGPSSAIKTLHEALSFGCDKAFLISDKIFAGSDTLATAKVLSRALQQLGPFKIILAGNKSSDGETGQVGPSVAMQLGLCFTTYVTSIEKVTDNFIVIRRLTETEYERIKLKLPALLTVTKQVCEPDLPSLRNKIRALELKIPILRATDLGIADSEVGLKGSPTKVMKIFRPKIFRKGKIIKVGNVRKAVKEILLFLEKQGVSSQW